MPCSEALASSQSVTNAIDSSFHPECPTRLTPTFERNLLGPTGGSIAIQLSENWDNQIGCLKLVEPTGLEPVTSGLQSQRSPN